MSDTTHPIDVPFIAPVIVEHDGPRLRMSLDEVTAWLASLRLDIPTDALIMKLTIQARSLEVDWVSDDATLIEHHTTAYVEWLRTGV